MARKLQLGQEWILGSRIGDPSGFGRVHEATAADGHQGVVKLVLPSSSGRADGHYDLIV